MVHANRTVELFDTYSRADQRLLQMCFRREMTCHPAYGLRTLRSSKQTLVASQLRNPIPP